MSAKIQKIEVIIGQLRESFRCPICLDLMKNAVSTKCNHKFCRHCIVLSLGKKQSAQCPLCKDIFTKRSLQPLPQWNSLVNQVGCLITAFERDTGVQFSPKKSALPLSPLCSQQSGSSSSQGLRGKVETVPKCEIYVEDIPEEPLKNNQPKAENTNVNVRSGFPRKARKVSKKTATANQNNTDQLVKCIEEAPWEQNPLNQGNDDEQVVPNTRSTRNKSVPCNLAAFLETATESQLGGTSNINSKVTANKAKRSGKGPINELPGSSSSSSATSFKVPNNMGYGRRSNDAKTPERTPIADMAAPECNSATRHKVTQWFTEQCDTSSSVAESSASSQEVCADARVLIDKADDESKELVGHKRTIDMDSVYTKETMSDTESNKEEGKDRLTGVLNIEGNMDPASKTSTQVSEDDSVESGPVQRWRTRKSRKIESSISSKSPSQSSLPTTIESQNDGKSEVSSERCLERKAHLSYLKSDRFKRQMSSPGSDDPYTFKPSQRTPKAKTRRGRNNRQVTNKASKSKAKGKRPVVEVKNDVEKTTDENERVSRKRGDTAANSEKEKQSSAGIKTLLTYGKETEIVLFDALQEHNTDPFSSPNDVSKTEPDDQKIISTKKQSTKTTKSKRQQKSKTVENEGKDNVDQLAEEISQAEDYDFVFSQQIREEAEEYRKMFKKKTRNNPRPNRVSFDKDVIVVEDDKNVSSVLQEQNIPEGSSRSGNNPSVSPNEDETRAEEGIPDEKNDELNTAKCRGPPVKLKLRRSDPVSTSNQKNQNIVPRRQTRSTDAVTDWEKQKEMNRDLQPTVSRKRPVAEITPSKSGKHAKRSKTAPENSDMDVEELEIMEMNSASSHHARDSGSETESLESDEEPAEYEKPNLDVQPPEIKEMLSQTSADSLSTKSKSDRKDLPSSCIPESSQEEPDVNDLDGDAAGSTNQSVENIDTSVGESLGFAPLLSQFEEQQERNNLDSEEVIDVVIEIGDYLKSHEESETVSNAVESVVESADLLKQSEMDSSQKGKHASVTTEVNRTKTDVAADWENKPHERKRRSGSIECVEVDVHSDVNWMKSGRTAKRTDVELQERSDDDKIVAPQENDECAGDVSQKNRRKSETSDHWDEDEGKTVQIAATPVGKLVKRRRSESDTSEDNHLDNKVAKAVTQKSKRKSRKIVAISQDESSSESDAGVAIQPKLKQKKKSLPKAGLRSTIKTKDSCDSSDSEEESRSKRRSGVRAVRGLAALSMSQSPRNQTFAKFTSPCTPKTDNDFANVKRSNTIDRDNECEITMVEGTPQVNNSTRFGKFLSSQTANSKTITESQKSQTQSQDIICDTPDERDVKRISPRKQKTVTERQDDREDYVPPTPPKPPKSDRKLNSTYHVPPQNEDQRKVTPVKTSGASTQGSSLDQDSESLIQPKRKSSSQADKQEECKASEPEIKSHKPETENVEGDEVTVKEEPPWQIKFSPDGKVILRAKPTTPDDPVEVEERDVTSELERSKVQDNISADLALIESLKKRTPVKAEKGSISTTPSSIKPRRILTAVKDELSESYDGDESLPSLDPKDEKITEPVKFIDNESEDDEIDLGGKKRKSRPLISSDEDSESDASVTSSRTHNATSSSMSDVDTQMIQSKDKVEAEILKLQEQLDLMTKQYKEVVGDPEFPTSSQDKTNKDSEEKEVQDNTTKDSEANEDEVNDNKSVKVEADTKEIDNQANIETIDPDVVCPESVDAVEEMEATTPRESENQTSEKQSENTHPPSSSELVVQESDHEMFTTPTKVASSQRSRLSLSSRKKHKRSTSNPESPPACSSTPKGSSSSVMASQNSPVRSPTPPTNSNGNQGLNEAANETTSSVIASTNALLSKYKTTPRNEEENRVAGVKKRLLEDQNDPSVDPKRPRIQNSSEKENLKRLSLIDKVEVSPALGSLKSNSSRSSLSPAPVSSANTSFGLMSSIDLPQKPNWCITISGVKKTKDKKLIKNFCSSLGCPLVEKYSPKVTHIIMKPAEPGQLKCEWTLKYFQGVTAGKWVVSAEWIFDCMREGVLLPEDKYEINGDTNNQEPTHAAYKARTTNTRLMSHLEVCCAGQFVNLPRDELHDLLDSLGARVVQEPSMFTYDEGLEQIILVDSTDPEFNRKKMIKEGKRRSAQVVEKNWILNCIGAYEVKNTEDFPIPV